MDIYADDYYEHTETGARSKQECREIIMGACVAFPDLHMEFFKVVDGLITETWGNRRLVAKVFSLSVCTFAVLLAIVGKVTKSIRNGRLELAQTVYLGLTIK